MKAIRKLLHKMLGLKGYLGFISRWYIRMIKWGMLKRKYPEIHYLKTLIRPDYICVDIGANLGYYSSVLARTASRGRVHAVEPIPLFADIWYRNMRRFSNAEMHCCALGEEEGTVKMEIPMRNGIVRHGLTKISGSEESAQDDVAYSFEVAMRRGDDVFADLERVDYLKCDVEGYERYVIASLNSFIRNHLPIIQIELNGEENRADVYHQLTKLGYRAHVLAENELVKIDEDQLQKYDQDFYFLHFS